MIKYKIITLLFVFILSSRVKAQKIIYFDTLFANANFYKKNEDIKIKTKFFDLYLKTNDTSIISFEIKNISENKIVLDTKRMYLFNNEFHCFITDESDSLSSVILSKNQIYKSKNYFFNKKNITYNFFIIISDFKNQAYFNSEEFLLYININEKNKKNIRKTIKRKL